MSKKALITVNGTYRKIRKGFITVDSTYRKIRKAFITVGGVYRPCWSCGELVYYGEVTDLQYARYDLLGNSTGDHALFAGGYSYDENNSYGVIESYNGSLTRSTLSQGMTWGGRGAATENLKSNGYMLFAGGAGPYKYFGEYVDAFDRSLTRVANALSLSEPKCNMGTAPVGDYAIFAGGGVESNYNNLMQESTTTVDAFNSSLTKIVADALPESRYDLAGGYVADCALFGGGVHMPYINASNTLRADMYAYNSGLTRTSAPSLSFMGASAAGNIGGRALFIQCGDSTAMDIYDSSLTKTTADGLGGAYSTVTTTNIDDYLLAMGGSENSGGKISSLFAFNRSLTRTTHSGLKTIRQAFAAAPVKNFVLYGGGSTYDSYYYRDLKSAKVEAYTVA